MTHKTVQFRFGSGISMREVKGTLHLARLAAESLHGIERVRLEAKYSADDADRLVVIDRSTEPGRTLAIIFAGYARREFGDTAVVMHHVENAAGVPV